MPHTGLTIYRAWGKLALHFNRVWRTLPRRFKDDDYDHIIYDEDQEVDEMYFIQEGFIGIGYTTLSSGITNQHYKMVKKQRNQQLICDHYVINKRKS